MRRVTKFAARDVAYPKVASGISKNQRVVME
jgi:hypothetical protein